ncbi:MAG: hypothetical protein ABJE95_38860 [Byssovorax sp.]
MKSSEAPGKSGVKAAASSALREASGDAESLVEVTATLDLPGETGRQARIFAAWAACLALAVIVGSILRARTEDDLSRARADKAKAAIAIGLALPALLTWGLNRSYRRGGRHARGITVDVTADGELRVWGRGYGARVALEGAQIHERLVDVYAGRLGAWRQRRLRVRAGSVAAVARGGSREIELATTATVGDVELAVEGGEGDCIEIDRDDFDRIRELVLARVRSS